MIRRKRREALEQARRAMEVLRNEDSRSLYDLFYQPHRDLKALLVELKAIPTGARFSGKRGQVMEQIACSLISGLEGITHVRSYRTTVAQHDLIAYGDSHTWIEVLKTLRLDPGKRDILIEAKAQKKPVGDAVFGRLCAMMEQNFSGASLGVFVTLKGASGFSGSTGRRSRKVGDSKLRQLLFHARTRIPIIVLAITDLEELAGGANLCCLMAAKIRDIEELAGAEKHEIGAAEEIELPEHLETVWNRRGTTEN